MFKKICFKEIEFLHKYIYIYDKIIKSLSLKNIYQKVKF